MILPFSIYMPKDFNIISSKGNEKMRMATIERVAIHEAGHAVIAHLIGLHLENIYVEPDIDRACVMSSKSTLIPTEKPSDSKEITEILMKIGKVALGGIAAEFIYDGKPGDINASGARNDLKEFQKLLNDAFGLKLTAQQIIDLC